MKLSILDQTPLYIGETVADALQASKELAVLADKLGYTRYWITEHHDLKHVACPAPEILISYLGAHTKRIRIGAGAILLPHYKPYKVAETFNTLATLFPGRIDLGLGRAPGGSAEATTALSGRFLEEVRRMPEKVEELLRFMRRSFPQNHMYHSLDAAPVPTLAPEPWLLGTGMKSAKLAAKNKMSYAFGYFMSDKDGNELLDTYRSEFVGSNPYTLLAVSVICSETKERAEELAHWVHVLNDIQSKGEKKLPTLEEAKEINVEPNPSSKLIAGTIDDVVQQLEELKTNYQPDELMITTMIPSRRDRLSSFQLIGEALIQQ
ncbi:LLM class flavin-dependent oxidoreductase [Pseudalkalibacillus hwajinpoensis]|uniref:LLM class flavin-dependent oxidoreductase n=1 Tax=Guptibacillus hwajinpoensis TaxID=208199 RepID=A0A4U1ML74_9BACL|nr:LLM class flavin-dependent oxidoreductase [Pseudalkalibacillus hwajinpoensis]TKD71376.1 LLM class flavin-dependent oxidoreductase [Pseudalkalibacillus hwajinpoensis]